MGLNDYGSNATFKGKIKEFFKTKIHSLIHSLVTVSALGFPNVNAKDEDLPSLCQILLYFLTSAVYYFLTQ